MGGGGGGVVDRCYLSHLSVISSTKSSGQFIYASTVVKFVDDRDHNPERQVNIILGTRSAFRENAVKLAFQVPLNVIIRCQRPV
jgi:hypothetical protein